MEDFDRKFSEAVKQSQKLRKEAEANSPEKRALFEAVNRKKKISKRNNIDLCVKTRKKGEVIKFGHFEGVYLQKTTVGVYVNHDNNATLRLIKGEAGDLIKVLKNNKIGDE